MDTTIAAIGNAIDAFGKNPDQFELLRQDASLIPAAFNETLRLEALMHAQGRGTTRDVDVDGTIIPAGSQIALLFYAGNRDPRHYEDPDTFRVERNPIDHLSFGYGIHGCAGQGLARLEAYAVLDALRRRVKSFTVGEGVRKINNSSRGLDSLPVLEVVPA
jgi:cytochrome P450